ncbi:hypothetical protein DdX_12475 [Ditylenchus destructor]|uniref:OTU domain-containing protein n=1 Tax=Ditylenchus destructor TaxID=166010 RepID=A0AAD4MY54_9BILA|nr:hypothetical protein DdX_12475 [Ditylenchus destructor]
MTLFSLSTDFSTYFYLEHLDGHSLPKAGLKTRSSIVRICNETWMFPIPKPVRTPGRYYFSSGRKRQRYFINEAVPSKHCVVYKTEHLDGHSLPKAGLKSRSSIERICNKTWMFHIQKPDRYRAKDNRAKAGEQKNNTWKVTSTKASAKGKNSAKKRASDIVVDLHINRKKAAGPRELCYAPVTTSHQKQLSEKHGLSYAHNKALNMRKRNFFCDNATPLTRIVIEGDGNCYFRALSTRVTGTDRNHEALRLAMMAFASSAKSTSELIGKLHEATNITPSKRMTPAANYDDVDKYARFPLDYVIAAKFLQLNLLVFNEKQEWEVYRPDATICQPLLATLQENVATIAIEHKEAHVSLINTIG